MTSTVIVSIIAGLGIGMIASFLPIGKLIYSILRGVWNTKKNLHNFFDKRQGYLDVAICYTKDGQTLRTETFKSTHLNARELRKWEEKNLETSF